MTAYVVRHAKAGDRVDWEGDDRLRPLSRAGKAQAEAVVEILKDAAITTIFSSPYLRCVQTVEPLARHLRLTVEPETALAEGAGAESIGQLIGRYPGRNVVFCTHGDVIEGCLQELITEGLIPRARAIAEKASTWVVEEERGRLVRARYIPAP
ncbi:MAG: histidine phosphatase family protein [Candidatus Dormibacteraeota bacterium]|nr:histidine phosphatase family protein [Candidatus Dormibacteraeota bacterium]